MHKYTPKQEAINAIEGLRDDAALNEIAYRHYVLSKAQQGLQDIYANRVIPADQLASEIEQW
jgi:hypothetical protein